METVAGNHSSITAVKSSMTKNFMQLKLTNGVKIFFLLLLFLLLHVIAHHIAAITWGKFLLLEVVSFVVFIPQIGKTQLIYCRYKPYRDHPSQAASCKWRFYSRE